MARCCSRIFSCCRSWRITTASAFPERNVHAKGSGAHGTLTITADLSRYTKAAVFAKVGSTTPCFLRFSTVAGERGAADAERDVRGFAVKFYTSEGNWDIVGNNTPVFFVRDPMKFPDFIHTQKRHPRTNLRNNVAVWDYWSLSPEAMHQITILMSDRGIPRGYRHIHGFGSHTFSFINAANERFWVKFHFKTQQGIQNLSDAEAAKLIGQDRESSQRDLYDAIERREFPRWTCQVQIMPEAEAARCPVDPFDLTKVWPHKLYPLIDYGVLELNRNPADYFAEVEQACFSPSNVVPGSGFSPDKVLQARLFAYPDAHRYRVGTHHDTLPINRPLAPVATYQRDGGMLRDPQIHGEAYYEPNSFGGPAQSKRHAEPPLALHGAADRYDHRVGNDDYRQAGDLFRMLKADEQARICQRIADSIRGVPQAIIERQLEHFRKADPAYGAGVAAALKG